jgi:hypothetical protein
MATGAKLVDFYEASDDDNNDDANAIRRTKDVLERGDDRFCFTIASCKRLGKKLTSLGVCQKSTTTTTTTTTATTE